MTGYRMTSIKKFGLTTCAYLAVFVLGVAAVYGLARLIQHVVLTMGADRLVRWTLGFLVD